MFLLEACFVLKQELKAKYRALTFKSHSPIFQRNNWVKGRNPDVLTSLLFETAPARGASFIYSSIVARNEGGGFGKENTKDHK